jgi:hypothetical protein
MDKHANYFVINLVTSCSTPQRLKLLLSISENLFNICINKYGIHPIQAILNVPLNKEEEFVFRERLQGKIVSLALVTHLIRASMARL